MLEGGGRYATWCDSGPGFASVIINTVIDELVEDCNYIHTSGEKIQCLFSCYIL